MHWIEKCWYQRHKAAWLLLPFSALYLLVITLRRLAYQLKLKASFKVKAPVIIVGNITVGGTGKTPFTLWLCHYLQQQGLKPGIISRGYGANVTLPRLVQAVDVAAEVGDEPLLLARRSGCPVVVCRNRVAAAEYLLANTEANIIISDDGLQHYRIKRDLEIVLIDGTRGLGNGFVLPAGPLREPTSRLNQADIVIANTQPYAAAHGLMTLEPEQAIALVSGEVLAPPATVSLVAGIGNPERFHLTAVSCGFQIKQRYFFGDHHQFSPQDLTGISGPVLMTEKDAVKCQSFARENWFSLAIKARLNSEAQQLLADKIHSIRSRYGI